MADERPGRADPEFAGEDLAGDTTAGENTADEEPTGGNSAGEKTTGGHRPRPEPSGDNGGNIAGSLRAEQPLEPEAIDLENAVFLLLGVLFVVLFLASAISGF